MNQSLQQHYAQCLDNTNGFASATLFTTTNGLQLILDCMKFYEEEYFVEAHQQALFDTLVKELQTKLTIAEIR